MLTYKNCKFIIDDFNTLHDFEDCVKNAMSIFILVITTPLTLLWDIVAIPIYLIAFGIWLIKRIKGR